MKYSDLIVWKLGMRIAKMVYTELIPYLPNVEKYGLADQMRRSAVSIPSNIAEGHARDTTKEYIKFLNYAKGSVAELQTQILLCVEIGYLNNDQIKTVMADTNEISSKLNNLILYLKEKL